MLIGPLRHGPPIKRAALLLTLAVLAVGGWYCLRTPIRQLWTTLGVDSILHPKPILILSPLFICTGVDSNGVPTGVSDRFTQDQLLETGVMAYITFSGAIPQKTTFQMRWTAAGKTYTSPVHPFERDADSIRLNLGKDLPPGDHQIEFLVDGTVRKSASMTVESPSSRTLTRQRHQRAAPPEVREIGRPAVAAVAERAVPITPTVEPLPPVDSNKAEPPVQPAMPALSNVIKYPAKHWHSLGSCSGELLLTPQSIDFTSEQHAFKFDINDVQLDKDGIKDSSGRAWHFFIRETNVEQLLGKWKSNHLFTGLSREDVPSISSPTEPRKSTPHIYAAKHKHRIGSCSGELTLTVDAVEFSSNQHYIKSYINKTQINGDGILDQKGDSWRFEVTGEDTGNLLRLWKNGTLFRGDTAH